MGWPVNNNYFSFIYLLFIISSLGLVHSFSLTYPIKGAYIGWEELPYAYPGSSVIAAADAGYNLVVLSFHSNAAYEMLQAWDTMSQSRQVVIDYAHSKGTAILVGMRIQESYGNLSYVADATELGIAAAGWVSSRGLDGIDIMIRQTQSGFRIGPMDSAASVAWVIALTTAIRNTLGPDAIITHSPDTYNFGPKNGGTGAGAYGGYTTIHESISSMIQHYNVFFFDQGPTCYVDYKSLFITSTPFSCPPYGTVQEISSLTGINVSRLVVAKPIQITNAMSGYMDAHALKDACSTAHAYLNWNAGVMGWSWNNSVNTSSNWINSVFPLDIITPTVTPATTSPSPPTPSPSTTGGLSTGKASTTGPNSGTTGSGSGNPIHGDCGMGMVKTADGDCECKSGYYKYGSECKDTGTLIMAIVIPLIVLPIIIGVVFFAYKKRRNTNGSTPLSNQILTRDPSRTMSLPELESNYESSNLIADYNTIVIKKRLGQGGSGVVNLGVWSHIDVAVKEFTNQDIQTTDFIRESEIHAKLRHPNVVQLLAICLPPHMCTISEFMAKGSLADVLQQKSAQFTWKRKIQALHDIAKGMDYLIKSKIIHRDLKSQNCLIDKNWTCKIADFGTSKLVNDRNATATAYVPRTAQWSAPEVITRGEYSEKSDVYSYGVIMWECFTGQIPYDGMFAFQVEDRTVKGSRLTIPVGCEAWFEALMQECWSADVDQRPTFDAVLVALEKAMT